MSSMRLIRVLVIDDSLTMRAIVESILGHHPDFEIIGLASYVEEAKIFLEERKPDVITLDLALPGIDGMEFLEELALGPHPPVIVVSSSTKDKSEKSKAAVKAGAVSCFDKARLVQDAPRFVRVLRKAFEKRYGMQPLPVATAPGQLTEVEQPPALVLEPSCDPGPQPEPGPQPGANTQTMAA